MKTAVCFCGQPRHLKKCIESIRKCIITPNNADVFFHFWANYPQETHPWHHSEDVAWKILSLETLKDMLRPQAFLFEPQIEFDVSAFLHTYNPTYNVWSWTYSSKMCHTLYDPEDYDIVIHCRPDLLFHAPYVIRDLDDHAFYVEHRGTSGDQFGYSVPQVMQAFAQLHDNLPVLYDQIGYVQCEQMVARHMQEHGYSMRVAPVHYTLWRAEHDEN